MPVNDDGPDYKPTPVSMPAQPKTKELPAMTERALLEDLRTVVKAGFAEVRADVQLVSSDLSIVKDRVVILEKFKLESEERQSRHSGGARQLSESDSKQDASIGLLVADVAALKAGQTRVLELLEKLESVAANPMVRRVAYAIGGAILTYLASKGLVSR